MTAPKKNPFTRCTSVLLDPHFMTFSDRPASIQEGEIKDYFTLIAPPHTL